MSGELFLLMTGAALLLLGALGRGGLVGARAGGSLALAAAAGGVLCVVAAMILLGRDDRGVPAGPVSATITNSLGPGQLSEEIAVSVNGRRVGVVKVDEQSPTARLAVTVPRAGSHDYSLEVTRRVQGRAPMRASGEGTVRIDGRSAITVLSSEDGDTFLQAE